MEFRKIGPRRRRSRPGMSSGAPRPGWGLRWQPPVDNRNVFFCQRPLVLVDRHLTPLGYCPQATTSDFSIKMAVNHRNLNQIKNTILVRMYIVPQVEECHFFAHRKR
jgi:hypothetical protein